MVAEHMVALKRTWQIYEGQLGVRHAEVEEMPEVLGLLTKTLFVFC